MLRRTTALLAVTAAVSALLTLGSVAASPAAVQALDPFPRDFATWHETPLATPGGRADAIATDASGQVWYSDSLSNQIVGLRPDTGTQTVHDLGAVRPGITSLAMGADGMLWFNDLSHGAVGRLDPVSGAVETFPLGAPTDSAMSLTSTPDGLMWFGDLDHGGLASITGDGTITRHPDPDGALAMHLVRATDGRLWYTRDGLTSLGVLDPRTGAVDLVPLGLVGFSGLAASPAGDVWVGGFGGVARVSPAGGVTIVPVSAVPWAPAVPVSLVAGEHSALYFTDENGGLGRVDFADHVDFLRPPFTGATPDRLAVTPTGTLWYTDFTRSTLGSL
ncbi:Vgb family protein [Herbiconiux liukaitaii]|uniref:Vgb family protein n=1 Tax=Herbiconiux liukaitaii TaxID=3342799 RepID=UPI0035B9FFD5